MFCPKNNLFFRGILAILLFSTRISCDDEINGEILAFADVDYDRLTDLIVKRDNHLYVYRAVAEKMDIKLREQASFKLDDRYTVDFSGLGEILNLAVADFNGDSFSDLLVSTRTVENSIAASLVWGNVSGFHTNDFAIYKFKEQPIVINCDADAVSDFLTVELNGSKVCYLGQRSSRGFKVVNFGHADQTWRHDAVHAFVDITGDLNADVVVQLDDSKADKNYPKFQVLTRLGPLASDWNALPQHQIKSVADLTTVTLNASVPSLFLTTPDQQTFGSPVFDDFNRDGRADILIPACFGSKIDKCLYLKLLIWSSRHGEWFWVDVENYRRHEEDYQWTFGRVGSESDLNGSKFHFPLTLRTGDYNQNGFPDLLVILSSKNESKAFFIENFACNPKTRCTDFGRFFALSLNPVSPCPLIHEVAFFDLNEDGTLDILYECEPFDDAHVKAGENSKTSNRIQFSSWASQGDTTFLKVQAFTATCGSNCLNGKEGTGISLSGASLTYLMADTEGHNDFQAAYTVQSTTTHKSLLLPYALFGLGRSPNFVDNLTLGIPHFPAVSKTWPQIVPNSRIYVVPYPPSDPYRWVGRHYITPGRLILISGLALGGVCLLIIFLVIILQCYEWKQDKRERDSMKKRFHFDAM